MIDMQSSRDARQREAKRATTGDHGKDKRNDERDEKRSEERRR
ncbi:hypothetical protein [Paraburkholderia bannensis]|nr:hypothetical protein [Paraburkholderia bannensis]